MKSNILFIIPDKQELAVLTAQLQTAYTIHVTDSITGVEKIIGEENIQLVVCSREVFDHSVPRRITAPQTDDEFIKTLQECISANIHNRSLNVDWLARVMNMSRPTLFRKIKNLTRQTPNELIGSARLQQAAILIASANYKVFEVAEMVGFGSSSSFSKAFMKRFKETPIAYQRTNKNGGMHS
ncbi:helix-turn-helix domain-containing protein [Niastella sp. OAS944]|uniref:helix-turn-helix domain-containing protein n=1 Tax=Niastella sp. OAS944 TaxID=2664089 RepID=UPI0034905D39|nr:AraC-like DNA-binding protein [Chitinophagaceae bacterium OAS944]